MRQWPARACAMRRRLFLGIPKRQVHLDEPSGHSAPPTRDAISASPMSAAAARPPRVSEATVELGDTDDAPASEQHAARVREAFARIRDAASARPAPRVCEVILEFEDDGDPSM